MRVYKKTRYKEWNALEASLRLRSSLIEELSPERKLWISVLVQAGKDGDSEFLYTQSFKTICEACNLCSSLTFRTLEAGIRGSYVNFNG